MRAKKSVATNLVQIEIFFGTFIKFLITFLNNKKTNQNTFITIFRFISALWLLLMNVKLGAVYRLELCYVILKHAALIRRGV